MAVVRWSSGYPDVGKRKKRIGGTVMSGWVMWESDRGEQKYYSDEEVEKDR